MLMKACPAAATAERRDAVYRQAFPASEPRATSTAAANTGHVEEGPTLSLKHMQAGLDPIVATTSD